MAYRYINESGVIVPDTGTLLEEVRDEYRNALGQDISVDPSTPQGMLITAETLARSEAIRANADMANQINPNISGGILLDSICALTGLGRAGATRSLVVGTLTGINGTIVPAGTRVRTTLNATFELLQTTIIPLAGTIDSVFRAIEYGPIDAAPGNLTQIVDSVLGWETVTNAAGAALGTNTQSDYSLRTLRRRTLALLGLTLPEAIKSGLYALEGVQSLTFYENYTDSTEVVEGRSIAARTVYVCVNGGADEDIAAVLLAKKSSGSGWTGDVEVETREPSSTEDYIVKFDRPTELAINVRTTVKSESALIDVAAVVRQAILSYANGTQENEIGFEVGRDVSTWELGGAINRAEPRIYVQTLEISDDGGSTWTTSPIAILIDQIATIDATDISVTVLT